MVDFCGAGRYHQAIKPITVTFKTARHLWLAWGQTPAFANAATILRDFYGGNTSMSWARNLRRLEKAAVRIHDLALRQFKRPYFDEI